MELPDQCSHCGHDNMIDMEILASRPLAGLYSEYGYICSNCGKWKPCHVSSRMLDEKLKHLKSMRPDHPSFWYYFVKAYKRAQDIQERARNGEIRNPHMVES